MTPLAWPDDAFGFVASNVRSCRKKGRRCDREGRSACQLVQMHRLAHQFIEAAEEIVDFLGAGLGGDQVLDMLAE